MYQSSVYTHSKRLVHVSLSRSTLVCLSSDSAHMNADSISLAFSVSGLLALLITETLDCLCPSLYENFHLSWKNLTYQIFKEVFSFRH